MGYQVTKELQKFIFSVAVLTVLVTFVILILSSQVSISLDTAEVETYSVYRAYKDCNYNNLEQDNYYVKIGNREVNKDFKDSVKECKVFDEIEVCI